MNLLFDLYGVLLKTQTKHVLHKLEQAIGSGPEMWEPYWRLRPDYDAGRVTDEEYWERMRRELNLPVIDAAKARRADFDGWLEADQEMVDYVLHLKAQGHHVGLLSNIPEGLAKEVKAKHTWLQHFDSVAMSCEIGAEKPSPEAYAKALEMLQSEPEETHFFDDNPANVEAAQKLSLHAHLFTCIQDLKDVVE